MALTWQDVDRIIDQTKPQLLEKLDLNELLEAELVRVGVITEGLRNELQRTHSTPYGRVSALLDHIKTGPVKRFENFCKALLNCDQGHLLLDIKEIRDVLPQLGIVVSSGTHHGKGAVCSQPVGFTCTEQELKGIWDHCVSCKKALLLSHVVTFDGEPEDPGDDIINLAGSIIKVEPRVKDATSGQNREMIPIEGSKLLDSLYGSPPPVTVRLYADPGDGKTSFARFSVYSWSIDFLKHVQIKENGKLQLQPGCPKWKLMVFLSCRDVKTTVRAAIRDALGCNKRDDLMGVVDDGEWVVVFMDAFDEVHNQKTINEIHDYVKDCQKKGGPRVVITSRTNLCDIDGKCFDRFTLLPGFTEKQGLNYIEHYTERCQPLLPQPSQAPSVYEYAHQHKDKLKAVLCNPLRLHVFTALALRGEIDLSIAGDFNISMLFIPLERYLLQREGVEVSEQQKHAFYRLCLHALFSDIREFPETLLQEFGVIRAFYVFMVKTDRRNSSAKLMPYFTFGHEMVLEFFASRYILCLNEEERISLLLLICSDRQLRNVQKLVFELLLQDGGQTHIKLLQTILRFILIMQHPRGPVSRILSETQYESMLDDEVLRDLLHLHDCIKTEVPLDDILHPQHDKVTIKDAARIHEKIDEAFDCNAHKLMESAWFTYLNDEYNGTIQHVVSCVQTASTDVQQQLIHNTIHLMLPCRVKNRYGYLV